MTEMSQEGNGLSANQENLAIQLLDFRKRSLDFGAAYTAIEAGINVGLDDLSDVEKNYYRQQQHDLSVVEEIWRGQQLTPEEARNIWKDREQIVSQADTFLEVFPIQTADEYLLVAQAGIALSKDVSDYIAQGRQILDEADVDFSTPGSLAPLARLIAMDRVDIGHVTSSDREELLKHAVETNDRDLVRALSITGTTVNLDDEVPGRFGQHRQIIAPLLIKAGHTELGGTLSIDGLEKEIRNIINRKGKWADTQPATRMRSLQLLTESLTNIGTEQARKRLNGVVHEVIKNSQSTRDEQGLPTPPPPETIWLFKGLMQMDKERGSDQAKKILAAVPDKMFIYLSRKVMQEGYLTNNVDFYLADHDNIPFLRQLLLDFPHQFETVVDTITEIGSLDLKSSKTQVDIFNALRDLGAVTPALFEQYHKKSDKPKWRNKISERQDFVNRINKLRQGFFKNIPVVSLVKEDEQSVLEELVYTVYQPKMSYQEFKKLLSEVDDRCDDLGKGKYKVREEGYLFELKTIQMRLRQGEKPPKPTVDRVRRMLEPLPNKSEDLTAQIISKFITDPTSLSDDETKVLLQPMLSLPKVANLLARYPDVKAGDMYGFLAELEEIFGIYFRDNYHIALQPRDFKDLPAEVLEKLNAWNIVFDEAQEIAPEESNVVVQFSRVLYQEVIGNLHRQIKSNMDRYEQIEEVSTTRRLRAYISKNTGAFFAAGAVDICTKDDLWMWNNEKFFPIIIVDEDTRTVKGIVLNYIDKDDRGKPILLQRQFNHTEELSGVDPAAFCEAAIGVGRMFRQDNNIEAGFIPPQSGWHELSNKDGTLGKYLVGRYVSGKTPMDCSIKIASSKTVGKIYPVD